MPATRIDVEPGDAGWKRAGPLLNEVWSPEVMATVPWRHVAWAHAYRRVLVSDEVGEVACHVGLFVRDAEWDGKSVRIGGIGGVATHPERRGQGLASLAMQRAAQELKADGARFALLFCERHLMAFYRRLGWQPFAGQVFVEQPQGRIRFEVTEPMVLDLELAPRAGVLDLKGRPW